MTEQCLVSILVLMEVPLQLSQGNRGKHSYRVSILVLMEVPLQLQIGVKHDAWYGGFNPCFNGSSSSTG